jgi:hypothetical protein
MGLVQITAPPVGSISGGMTTTGSLINNAPGSGGGYCAMIIPLTTISAGSVVGGLDQETFDAAVAAFVASASTGDSHYIGVDD